MVEDKVALSETDASFAISVKSYIVKDGKLLIVKRKPSNVHYAGKWDIPGGRIKLGENPIDGVRRETREETGLEVEILMPIDVQQFTRDDGQKITMIIFLCRPVTRDIKISDEHEDYKWVDVKDAQLHPIWLAGTTQSLLKYGLEKFA